MKKYLLFVGIDISKKWIDVSMTSGGKREEMKHCRFDNDLKGFKKMIRWLFSTNSQAVKDACLFCMEHTGVYSIGLCAFLQEQQFDYVLESALRIKRSLGIKRGKDDKADSKDIAQYAQLHSKNLKTSTLPAQPLVDIKNLLAYRTRLVKKQQAIKVGAKETGRFSIKSSTLDWIVEESDELIAMVKDKIKKTEAAIKQIIAADGELKRLFDLVTSVKGIGLINGLQIIIHTNCFKAFDTSRQFACYIGIAPFHKKSGSSLNIPAKVSPLGHKKLKALLTNGVMSAIQYDKELKAYYERKIAEGKLKYKVLNAVKNKLISRVFATVKRGTPYVELFNYT